MNFLKIILILVKLYYILKKSKKSDMENILKKIVEKKKSRIIQLKKDYPINSILKNIKSTDFYVDFKKKIKKRVAEKKVSVIAEIKQASPSAGLLVKNFNHINIAKKYFDNGAPFLSVLTEEYFFLGKLEHISEIKKNIQIPILCKDFFIDPYQVALSKSFGADCILIILSAVDKVLAKDLYQAASDLNISTLVEVHNEKESEIALAFDKSLIGINNRNLKTLEISLDTTLKLSKILTSHENPLICESGIHSIEDMKFILEKTEIFNFLIGESLLTGDDIGAKLKEFMQISV
jgi:indole-3-glycerol phosphate synthase